MRNILTQTLTVCAAACVLTFVTGCETTDNSSVSTAAQPAPAVTTTPAETAPAATPPEATAPAAATATATAAPALKAGPDGIYRVKAGSSDPFTDAAGHVWQAEVGFSGGDVVDRDADLAITNTADPGLFRSEHYSMDSFSCSVPNGSYTAKLYFAETYEGITGPGMRVFSFNVQGTDFKDFDVWAKAGGPDTAYVVSVPVKVTDGKFTITFTPNVENPEINAIELDPQH